MQLSVPFPSPFNVLLKPEGIVQVHFLSCLHPAGSSSDDSRGAGSDSGDDVSSGQGGDNASHGEAAPLQREGWMHMTGSLLDSGISKQQEEKQKEEEERAKVGATT